MGLMWNNRLGKIMENISCSVLENVLNIKKEIVLGVCRNIKCR